MSEHMNEWVRVLMNEGVNESMRERTNKRAYTYMSELPALFLDRARVPLARSCAVRHALF